MSTLNLLKQRRSIRLFTEEKISPADKKSILTAGLLSPTGMGRRHIELITIEDKASIEKLVHSKAHGTRPLATATLAIIILGDTSISTTWVEDTSICAILMQLEIDALGLGSTWVHLDKRQTTSGQDADEALRESLGYPSEKKVLCILAVGHKDEEKEPRSDDFIDFSKVHEERY